MITYTKESLIDDWDNVVMLGRMAWEEVEDFLEEEGFELDKEMYESLEDSGNLRYYTMETEDGVKVGMAVFIIINSTHSKGSKVAQSDCVYILPSYRGVGLNFIKMCLKDLKEEGAKAYQLNLKVCLDTGVLGNGLGAVHCENVYQGVL